MAPKRDAGSADALLLAAAAGPAGRALASISALDALAASADLWVLLDARCP